jgi:hypothetical protein
MEVVDDQAYLIDGHLSDCKRFHGDFLYGRWPRLFFGSFAHRLAALKRQ